MTEPLTDSESYLTEDEVNALQTSGLSRKTPFIIQDVSRGYFSVARFYGGATFNGSHYVYDPKHDELLREDVLQWVTKRRKQAST